jgi:hypothetical protein
MRSKLVGILATLVGLCFSATTGLAGPPNGGPGDIIAKYYSNLGGSDLYQVDDNGNFVWNGSGGGDSVTLIAPGQGAGIPLVGDDDALCKSIGTLVFCDQNRNGVWEGNGGGDLATNFSPGAGTGPFLYADTTGDGVEELIKYLATDVFQIDANQNSTWNGPGGGDAVAVVAPGAGPGIPFSCDCDGNGTTELGKVITADSTIFIDLNNNGVWDGNGGGDVATGFAGGAGTGTFVFANVNGVAGDDINKYYDNLGGSDLFQVDENGNRTWNGTGGGDRVSIIAPGAGPGVPCAIDPEGDDSDVLCKTISSTSQVFADLNNNGVWEGNGGGDLASSFAPGAGAGTFVTTSPPPGP